MDFDLFSVIVLRISPKHTPKSKQMLFHNIWASAYSLTHFHSHSIEVKFFSRFFLFFFCEKTAKSFCLRNKIGLMCTRCLIFIWMHSSYLMNMDSDWNLTNCSEFTFQFRNAKWQNIHFYIANLSTTLRYHVQYFLFVLFARFCFQHNAAIGAGSCVYVWQYNKMTFISQFHIN